jgi:hypothetical protein
MEIRYLHEYSKWTTPKPEGYGSLMSRTVNAWNYVKPFAMTTKSKSSCTWSPEGHVLNLTWDKIRGREIDVDVLRRLVKTEAQELTQAVKDTFPYLDLSDFTLSRIADNPESPESLFDRTDNKTIFKRYIDQIWTHLGRYNTAGVTPATPIYNQYGRMNKKAATSWLEKPANLLRLMLRHFYRTCGIAPRAWQTCDLLYRACGGYMRNFRLLRHNTPFIGNPKAKQRDKLIYDAFWALPAHLGIVFLIILGVVRPIEIKIMDELGIPTHEHKHYIFVYTNKRRPLTSYVMVTSTINEVLHCGKPELSYESRAYRHVFQAIFDHHICHLHPDSVEHMLRSAGDNQAQHSELTHDDTYAQDEISRGAGLPLSKRNQQLAISKGFHSWFEFSPGDIRWSSYANYQPGKDINVNKALALAVARKLVIRCYGVADGGERQRKQCVARVMASKPFLLGLEVCLYSFIIT